jgi:hypothetical protein
MSTLLDIINQIDLMLPQLDNFIDQFHTTLLENNINIVTDSSSNMFMEVPSTTPEDKATFLRKKLDVIDRLVNTKSAEVDKLLKEGSNLELNLKKDNPEFQSKILAKVNELNKLKAKYRHMS